MAGSAWPGTPRTFVADELITSDIMNSAIRDTFRHIKAPPYGASALAATIAITATTFTNVNSALAVGITTYGGMLDISFVGGGAHVGAGNEFLYCDAAVDGTRVTPGSNGAIQRGGTGNVSFFARATGIASGAHVVTLQAKVSTSSDGTIMSGAVLEVMEVP